MIFYQSKIIFLIILIIAISLLCGQDYSFDLEEFDKKPYEYVGTIQVQSDFSELNEPSGLYKLSYLNEEYLDSYLASLQLKGSYELSKYKLSLNLKNQLFYTSQNKLDYNFDIYETFINADISTNYDFQIGKKSVKWGKGYIWNPVSFVGRQKDINDIDAGLEGFWMIKLDYVKSLSALIQNFSISPVLIPVNREVNEDFSSKDGLNFILNNYFLIKDTDVGLYFLADDSQFRKFGADLALNILPNWEIHAEYVLEKDVNINRMNSDLIIKSTTNDFNNLLIGTRILFETNITVILEYLHNDSGLDNEQMSIYFDAIDLALSDNPELLTVIKNYQLENFSSQYLMQDYIYAKLSHPEPFDFLYFTPSVFVLYNLNDKSGIVGGEFNYSRFNNLNLKLKYNILFGDLNSEFGGKINSKKLSLLIEFTF